MRGGKGENSRLLSPPPSLRCPHYLKAWKRTTTNLKILILVVPVFRLFLLLLCVTVLRNLFALKYSCYTLKTYGHVLNRMIFGQAQKAIRDSMKSNGTELEKVVHTSNIVLRRLAERVWFS